MATTRRSEIFGPRHFNFEEYVAGGKYERFVFDFDADFIDVLRERFVLPLENLELFPYKDVLTNYKTSLDGGVVETV